MKTTMIALGFAVSLAAPALQAASGDAGNDVDDAESYCAKQADQEQVVSDELADYMADCIADRRETLQSDEGDAVDKSAGTE